MGILLCGLLLFQAASLNAKHKIMVLPESDIQISESIKIFPNPTNGRFNLSLAYEGNERIVAKVYDLTGKMIKDISNDLVKDKSSVTADIDLNQPTSGIYFLRVEIGNKIATKKIIVK